MANENSEPTKALDADSMDAIRAMLVDEPPVAPLPSGNRPEPQLANSAQQSLHTRRQTPEIQVQQPAEARAHATSQTSPLTLSLIDSFKAKIINYRPTRRHIVFGALFLLAVFRPGLLIGLMVLAIFITIAVFLILGYDGFWRNAMRFSRWYAQRRPERATTIHRRIDNFAMRWDAVLDRFPEGTVDGLYLPDFGELAAADKRHEAAMDRRLKGMHSG